MNINLDDIMKKIKEEKAIETNINSKVLLVDGL